LRLKTPPSTFEEFYNQVLQRNQPMVIENASHIFGPKVQRWTNLVAFLQRYGNLPVDASLFDTTDTRTRFGITPFPDDTDKTRHNLWAPYHQHVTLQELLEFNATNRLLFAEQFGIYNVRPAKTNEDEDEDEEPDIVYRYDAQGAPIPFDNSNSHIGKNKLYQDWKTPAFMPNLRPEAINLWMGRLKMGNTGEQPDGRRGHQKVSPLHYDPTDNVMLQLLGTKTFYMYHAVDAVHLHPEVMKVFRAPHPNTARQARQARHTPVTHATTGVQDQQLPAAIHAQDNFSPVDPVKVDAARFPHAQHATRIKCKVQAGEALYMPSFTWHNVVSEGEEAAGDRWRHGMNMGINVWSMGDRRFQVLFETVMHWLQNGEHEEDVLGRAAAGRGEEEL